MRKINIVILITAGIGMIYSCSNSAERAGNKNLNSENQIVQQPDGTISLNLDKADSYSDMSDPSSNTAEWNVLVSKSGRYNVWLSSATKDTTNLKYKNSVLLSFQDMRITGVPACDKIIQNSSEVSFPYYRADSFLGSMYIRDTGVFNIQIMSEQILPKNYKLEASSGSDYSKLLKVLFTPEEK